MKKVCPDPDNDCQMACGDMRRFRISKKAKAVCVLVLLAAGTAVWWTKPRPPQYEGVPVRQWVHEALTGDWPATIHQRVVVAKVLRERAIPDLIRELDAMRESRVRQRILAWLQRLPAWLRVFEEDEGYGSSIMAASYVLEEMGEAGEPAIPALVRCIERNDLHLSEYMEVVWDLHWMGPPARAAVPMLRRDTNWMGPAVAIYAIDGTTEAVVQTLARELAGSSATFVLDSHELWWHRHDENLTSAIAPLLCGALTNESSSATERVEVAEYLGELVTENAQVWAALRFVLQHSPEPALEKAASDALAQLEKNLKQRNEE